MLGRGHRALLCVGEAVGLALQQSGSIYVFASASTARPNKRCALSSRAASVCRWAYISSRGVGLLLVS